MSAFYSLVLKKKTALPLSHSHLSNASLSFRGGCLNSVKLLHASRYCASNVEPCHTLPISLSPFRDHCATRPQQLWWMRCNSPLKLVVMLMSRLQVWPLHITNHRQQQAVSYVELILVLLKLFPESNRVPIFNNYFFLKKGVKNNNCIKMWGFCGVAIKVATYSYS